MKAVKIRSIFLGGSQFTRYSLSVLSLCLKERPKWKSGRVFCVACYEFTLTTNLVARKPAFWYHLWGKQNYQALFIYRSGFGHRLCHVWPYFTYNSAVFHRIILQDKLLTHLIFRTIEAHASLAQQIIKWQQHKTFLNKQYPVIELLFSILLTKTCIECDVSLKILSHE